MEKLKTLVLLAAMLLTSVTAWAGVDPCNDSMGHTGNGTKVEGNKTGTISGTPWGYEQWYQGGNSDATYMTYYNNGTFKANWSNVSDYLTRVGYQYGDNGPGVDHTTKDFSVDYKYTKTGSAQYGYIGVYGWTVNPQVEYYIVDDWYSKPNEQYIGEKFGEIEVDGAKYTIHAFLRQQEPSKTGTSTFVQIFSVRETPRQCGHIDISAHFKKWDELFTGQTKQLRGSKGGGAAQLKFGKPTEVMLLCEAGGAATGSIDYTYFNMTDSKPIAYATLATDNKTLTFKYGNHNLADNNEWNVNDTGTTGRGWSSHATDITKVVFDESFATARPVSCSAWFEGCTNLTAIEGLEYLNTSETLNLERMFNGCSSLKTLTIGQNFTVGSGTTADNMFQNCTGLQKGKLFLTGTTVPSIAQDIFNVIDGGLLVTDMEPADLGVTGPVEGKYTWKGGQFRNIVTTAEPFEYLTGVKFIDANGTEQTTPEGTKVRILDGTETTLGRYGKDPATKNPYVTWYVCNNDLSYDKIAICGDIESETHIILADGATMSVDNKNSNDEAIEYEKEGPRLFIYGQSQGTGKLTASTADYVAIRLNRFTINGGSVEVKGVDNIAAIFSNIFTMNGGALTVTGSSAIKSSYGVNINGGKLTADGNIYAGENGLTLSWRNTDDWFKAGSITLSGAANSKLRIAAGKRFLVYNGDQFTGFTPNSNDAVVLNQGEYAGKTLRPLDGYILSTPVGITAKETPDFTISETLCYLYKKDAEVTIHVDGHDNDHMEITATPAITQTNEQALAHKFIMPAQDVTIIGVKYYDLHVPYMSWDDTQKKLVSATSPENAKVYVLQGTESTIADGWYIAKGKIKFTPEGPISTHGDTKLILADGAEMTLETSRNLHIMAIKIDDGNLTITGQSEGTGKLIINHHNAIRATYNNNTTVNINGGIIKFTIPNHGVSIEDVETLNINGGAISVKVKRDTESDDDSKCFEAKTINVTGGDITTDCPRGFLSTDDINISGGKIDVSNGLIKSFDGNIYLSWSNSSDFIIAKTYAINTGIMKIADGKSFIAYTPATTTDSEKQAVLIQGKEGGVTLNDFARRTLASKVLRPAAADDVTVSYMDWDDTQKKLVSKNTASDNITDNDIVYVLNGGGATTLPGGWYAVTRDIYFTNKLLFTGEAHLILTDKTEMSMNAADGLTDAIECSDGNTDYDLTIYAQSSGNDTGKLTIICCHVGIKAERVTINGGNIKVNTNDGEDDCQGIYAASGVTFNSGNVDVDAHAGTGIPTPVTLRWSHPSDRIRVSNYGAPVTIPAGYYFSDGFGLYGSPTTGYKFSSKDDVNSHNAERELPDINSMMFFPVMKVATDEGQVYAGLTGATTGVWEAFHNEHFYVVTSAGYNTSTKKIEVVLEEVMCVPEHGAVIVAYAGGNTLYDATLKGADASSAKSLEYNFYLTQCDAISDTSTPTPLFVGADGTQTADDLLAATLKYYNMSGTVDDYIPFVLKNDGFIAATTTGNVLPAGTTVLFVKKFDILRMINNPEAFAISSAPALTIPLNLGDETTSLSEELRVKSEEFAPATGWYTLDGRKLDKLPGQKGVYINKGNKVVIR